MCVFLRGVICWWLVTAVLRTGVQVRREPGGCFEFVRQVYADDAPVVGIEREAHPGLVELAGRVPAKIGDRARPHVRGEADLERHPAPYDLVEELLTSLIEPLMIAFVGGIIGAMIISLYMPIFKVFDLIH